MHPDDIGKKKTNTSSSLSPATDQYLAYLYVYREHIEQISKMIYVTPQFEFLSSHEKLNNLIVQLADVIASLETLSGNPLGNRFNKRAVLRHLNDARIELTMAATLASDHDRQVQIKCIDHIVKCRNNLNLAKSLMPSQISS